MASSLPLHYWKLGGLYILSCHAALSGRPLTDKKDKQPSPKKTQTAVVSCLQQQAYQKSIRIYSVSTDIEPPPRCLQHLGAGVEREGLNQYAHIIKNKAKQKAQPVQGVQNY